MNWPADRGACRATHRVAAPVVQDQVGGLRASLVNIADRCGRVRIWGAPKQPNLRVMRIELTCLPRLLILTGLEFEQAASLVDAGESYEASDLWGTKLTATQARHHPRIDEFWVVVDFLVTENKPALRK